VAFVVLSSVGGSIFGPIIGGFLQYYLPLSWNFWIQLIIGAVVQVIHFFCVPETRSSCIVTAEAQKRRKANEPNVYSEAEVNHRSFLSKEGLKHCTAIWIRPFVMFAREPIVLFLSLISGFSDALIFTFLDSLGLVYAQWHFKSFQTGLVFLAIGFGYILAYAIWLLVIRHQKKLRKTRTLAPEELLTWLLWTAPLLVIGIFGFAPTSTGAPLPWIAPTLFLILIGVANFAIYGATIDYMIVAYGDKYSASACGGNGFARDALAGIAAMYAHPLYTQMPGATPAVRLRNASLLLGAIATVLCIPIYCFWVHGPKVRARSPFANEVERERKRKDGSSTVDLNQGILGRRL
jgi:MFS family permease